jgi:hypothetical protein
MLKLCSFLRLLLLGGLHELLYFCSQLCLPLFKTCTKVGQVTQAQTRGEKNAGICRLD